jgi:hypothetical protein
VQGAGREGASEGRGGEGGSVQCSWGFKIWQKQQRREGENRQVISSTSSRHVQGVPTVHKQQKAKHQRVVRGQIHCRGSRG